jgi:hypothetical protein
MIGEIFSKQNIITFWMTWRIFFKQLNIFLFSLYEFLCFKAHF